ncbi:MAG: ABC transporter permease [Anaerolineaceae bacterium]|nr:ABC transporter permease [Anaerolineaceae bacterium]
MQETAFHQKTNLLRPSWRRRTPPDPKLIRRAAPFIVTALALVLWQLVTTLGVYPAFIVPPPTAVFQKFQQVIASGVLWYHTGVTLAEVLPGLGVGLAAALVLGYAIAKSPLLESLLSPVIVAFQSAPIVAYAPLLVIWFGGGPSSKIVTSALIVFFPMLMNTVVGIRTVPLPLRDLMRSVQASRWQTFTKLEIPAAMPVLISGLKISSTLAVIGAVVGEFVYANAGLGFYINLARNQYDTPLVVVGVITLTVIARLLYGTVSLVERRVLAWQPRAGHNVARA